MSGCGSSKTVAPSQNSALNSVSTTSTAKEEKGIMQSSLESWFETEWEPTVSKDKKVQEKYMEAVPEEGAGTKSQKGDKKVVYVEKEDKPFTLQEYVDKTEAYLKAKPNDYEHSNIKKVESLPVIGK